MGRQRRPKARSECFTPIAERPPIADDRSEVGHFEGDLICGSFNRSAIITIFDRASRYLLMADLPEGHNATATLAGLIELFDRVPQYLKRTLAGDQGTEIARHQDPTELAEIDVYRAEPHSPWQRPTNENGNCLIRRYVGKGTNFNQFIPQHLRTIEHRINTIPRRSLNWTTAETVYSQAAVMTGRTHPILTSTRPQEKDTKIIDQFGLRPI